MTSTESNAISIAGRRIGPGEPVYIIAEMSANHNGSFDRAADIVLAAKKAGADAVKIQTYTADTLTLDCGNEHFRIGNGTLWSGKTFHHLYQEAFTPWEWQPELKRIANDLGLGFFSSPFDATAVDFLEEMGVPAYKVASFEIVDLLLLRKIGSTGKPVILSTGMADIAEIHEAVHTLSRAGTDQIALLKCTSAYPAPPEEMNLRTIPHLVQIFNTPVGLSDHTLGITAPVVAVSLGATIVEKHFTLSRAEPGPDSAFSLEPEEFTQMAEAIRVAEKTLGCVAYEPSARECASRAFRRSLFVVKDIRAGEPFSEDNLRSIRPGGGLHTRYYDLVLGRQARQDIPAGTPLSWTLVGD